MHSKKSGDVCLFLYTRICQSMSIDAVVIKITRKKHTHESSQSRHRQLDLELFVTPSELFKLKTRALIVEFPVTPPGNSEASLKSEIPRSSFLLTTTTTSSLHVAFLSSVFLVLYRCPVMQCCTICGFHRLASHWPPMTPTIDWKRFVAHRTLAIFNALFRTVFRVLHGGANRLFAP